MPLTALIPFAFLAAVPLLHLWGDGACWLVLPGLLLVFVGFDLVLGRAAPAATAAGSRIAHRLPLWLFIAAQLAVIAWGLVVAHDTASLNGLLALAIGTGSVAGIFGMLAAHEMIHSADAAERGLGIVMLSATSYPHFHLSHLHGHHRMAGTREDPATARLGEGAYGFVLRSVAGQFTEAQRFERRRVAGRRWPALANRMHWYLAIVVATYLAIGFGLGWRALLFQAVQSAMAIFILELFNYIAHYGLARRPLPDGRLEAFDALHSWNATERFNNWALFNGGHHAHHHRAPAESYERLAPVAASPQLPCGFGGSIFMALIPPLWRRVMDPRVAAAMAG